MPRAGESYYYTAKKIDDMRYEFHKWDELGDDGVPVATYEIFPFGGPGGRGACGCPAYKRCKHLNAISEIIHAGRADELYALKWTEKGGWEGASI